MTNSREKEEQERRAQKTTRIDNKLADVVSNGYFDA
jgi:hypothetical protein